MKTIALVLGITTFALGLSLAGTKQGAAEDFHGYPCTVDCSGHEAGYEWAEQQDITDPDDCGGNSNSFIEGCQAWAEEQQDEQRSLRSGNSDSGDYGDEDDDSDEDSDE